MLWWRMDVYAVCVWYAILCHVYVYVWHTNFFIDSVPVCLLIVVCICKPSGTVRQESEPASASKRYNREEKRREKKQNKNTPLGGIRHNLWFVCKQSGFRHNHAISLHMPVNRMDNQMPIVFFFWLSVLILMLGGDTECGSDEQQQRSY